ncbi:hypothetical protein AMTRI_Chr10g232190 [Amborella trichopoda]
MAETALRVSLQKLCDPLVLGLAFLYKVPDQVERLRSGFLGGLANYILLIWQLRGLHKVGTKSEEINNKTTLAKKAYNQDDVKRHFSCFAWVCVSQTYQVNEILRGVINGVMTPPADTQNSDYQELMRVLSNHLQERRYLVVFDDIWKTDAWESIEAALPDRKNGSRVVITTRIEPVASLIASMDSVHYLKPLPKEESWELLCRRAFVKSNGRCGGLPLAFAVVGGLLSTKAMTPLSWKRVLDGFRWHLDEGDVKISDVLSLSYFDLPCYLKPCFLYLSVFPEDFKIRRTTLVQLWLAEGFIAKRGGETLEDVAEDYFEELVSRNMLQVERVSLSGHIKSCVVHDLLRALAIAKAKEENFLGVITGKDDMPSQRARSLTFHCSIEDHVSFLKNVRSFLLSLGLRVFGNPINYSIHYLPNVELLRVLVHENITTYYLPKQLGILTHLRYLSFRRSILLEKIPSSINNLQHLQTLDLRVSELFCSTNKGLPLILPRLRHFYVNRILLAGNQYTFDLGGGYSSWWPIQEPWGDFTQLMKLSINEMLKDNIETICNYIGKLKCLQSLTLEIQCSIWKQFLPPPPPPDKLPSWFGSLQCLAKLVLVHSRWNIDGFLMLQVLPKLCILVLSSDSYVRKDMSCIAGGFPRLQYLMQKLEEGSMPCLRTLIIMECHKLRRLPKRLWHIVNLQDDE